MAPTNKANRVAFGEVFTPLECVSFMLDMLPASEWASPSHIFLEDSCGDGAFVLPIVERRYKALGGTLDALRTALNTIHGWDIQQKHINTCRHRLLRFVYSVTQDPDFVHYAMAVIWHHIRRRDSLKDRSIPRAFDELPESIKEKKLTVARACPWLDIVDVCTASELVLETPVVDLPTKAVPQKSSPFISKSKANRTKAMVTFKRHPTKDEKLGIQARVILGVLQKQKSMSVPALVLALEGQISTKNVLGLKDVWNMNRKKLIDQGYIEIQ
jgi:hypothetical protein